MRRGELRRPLRRRRQWRAIVRKPVKLLLPISVVAAREQDLYSGRRG
ncbi:MAG TPA: hypothetical protein VJQ85_02025 [Gaiellaceae bacterium]|nr:hypothetical protein [Gaiellaceae bacterium]